MKQGDTLDAHDRLRAELSDLIVKALDLEDVSPADIDHDAPLFGEGLGLDSIDALELAFAVSEKYGVKFASGDASNHEIFASLNALTAHIAANRTK